MNKNLMITYLVISNINSIVTKSVGIPGQRTRPVTLSPNSNSYPHLTEVRALWRWDIHRSNSKNLLLWQSCYLKTSWALASFSIGVSCRFSVPFGEVIVETHLELVIVMGEFEFWFGVHVKVYVFYHVCFVVLSMSQNEIDQIQNNTYLVTTLIPLNTFLISS